MSVVKCMRTKVCIYIYRYTGTYCYANFTYMYSLIFMYIYIYIFIYIYLYIYIFIYFFNTYMICLYHSPIDTSRNADVSELCESFYFGLKRCHDQTRRELRSILNDAMTETLAICCIYKGLYYPVI